MSVINRSYRKERVVRSIIEWIELHDWQAKKLHDLALRQSGNVDQSLKDPERLENTLWKLSDTIQKSKRISTKQLMMIQKIYWNQNDGEQLYVEGLEYWLEKNVKEIAAWQKRYDTRMINEGKK